MTITFFFATHLFPGRAPRVMDFRATDDRFVIAIDAKGNVPHEDITKVLKEAGAVEIKHNNRKYVSYE
jgi:cell division ATPase FtsA